MNLQAHDVIPKVLRNDSAVASSADLTVFREIGQKMIADEVDTVEIFIPCADGKRSLIFQVKFIGSMAL